MSEQRNRVFLGQVYERNGKFGKFYSGRLGAGQLIVSESKETGKWNVYIEQNTQQERRETEPSLDRGAGVDIGDKIPF